MVIVGRLAISLVAGIVLSYAWELAQTPFYAGMDDLRGVLWHCFVAALGDGFLILFIFLVSAAVQGFREWFARPNAAGYGAMLVSGVLIGFAVEWWGLRIAERWEYSDLMPLVPGTAIGVVPIVQMLVLPVLVLWATRRLIHAA